MRATSGRRPSSGTLRKLAWFHRWLGVATCLVFALWFASGAVMLFQPFPSLPRSAQLSLQAPVQRAAVTIWPRAVASAPGEPVTALRLVQRSDAPAYIVTTASDSFAVDARSGRRLTDLTPREAEAAARAVRLAQAPSAAVEYDQWVVHNRFDPLRPLFRLDLADDTGTSLYLSARTGEFVQRTTLSDRAWNWVGAVLHWVYFTPLRASFTAWDRTVWILSLIALLVAIAGAILGVARTLVALRQRRPALTFYRLRWMRWHHLLGLFSGLFVLTWALSGWLSMDHGRLFSRGQLTTDQHSRYTGAPMADALPSQLPRAAPEATRQFDFTVVAGRPLTVAWQPDGSALTFGSGAAPLNAAAMRDLIGEAASRAFATGKGFRAAPIDPAGTYAKAEGWPATAVRVDLADNGLPDVYSDGVDGRLLTVMDDSRASYEWIYYALHTFNVPGLTTRPLLRKTLVVIPLLLGFIFSITGVVLGFQRLRKASRSNQGAMR